MDLHLKLVRSVNLAFTWDTLIGQSIEPRSRIIGTLRSCTVSQSRLPRSSKGQSWLLPKQEKALVYRLRIILHRLDRHSDSSQDTHRSWLIRKPFLLKTIRLLLLVGGNSCYDIKQTPDHTS